ncbi:mediator of RNA polymerase II transcription subunit 32 isoform X2 [Hordeum vulgare subsp. vulgare]|uniref:mediator of RNA polymerase II transcription subunit 32 isoform X2 n=1 Tax=Hordeum vulgare subsp. vulgare TaxID=112509 RepID=UPI000B479F65|nr:mediator of RNA polymerase II transcription subunit 32 isoform X2 [Hordeum vulgare subsp. vulgare]
MRKKRSGGGMDATVDELSAAYKEFVAAAVAVMEAREQSGGQKTAATDTALEAFKQRWELFRVSCDHAEELVESIRQRIGSECLVDEATGSSSSSSAPASVALAAPGIKPISAVRLEQMSKAVRWLVIELQHGAGGPSAAGPGGGVSTPAAGAGGHHVHGGVESRFPEDGTQSHATCLY